MYSLPPIYLVPKEATEHWVEFISSYINYKGYYAVLGTPCRTVQITVTFTALYFMVGCQEQ